MISQNAIFSGFERRCILLEISALYRGGVDVKYHKNFLVDKKGYFLGDILVIL